MALTAGTRLGVYEIAAQIGEGGMGQVYRATDTTLGRQVAIKILPDAFAADAERVARFEREAKTLASLNHPNIAAIYAVESSADLHALVMELVEGDDLSQRIARGAIPIDEALPIARQIAEALEAAHEQGIIHRDLKPANIKVRPDGVVKVLDFGLAKLAAGGVGRVLPYGPAGSQGQDPAYTQSPTITSPALMTGVGVLLGTAAYMSPEQAKGREADKRSDVWAFGCVLYEMLTGRRAFDAEDVAETLAFVLTRQPDWGPLPAATPEMARSVLRRCLQKDRALRLRDIGDARLELNEPDEARVEAPLPVDRRPRRIWPFVAATAAVAALTGVAGWMLAPKSVPALVRRYTIPVPASTSTGGVDVALSPDGRTFLYAVQPVGLLKRQADGLVFEPVRGAEGGAAPFFSPDGAWIGFRADGRLKKVPVEGGLAVPICDAPGQPRATWGDDGSIIMASGTGDLYRVSSNGGIPELILKADKDGIFSQPRFVPGSKAVLVRRGTANAGRIEVIELPTLARHSLVEGTTPQVAAAGDLVFEQSGGIWAVKFDVKRLAVTGAPVPVAESVRITGNGFAQFATSGDGSLAYIPGNTDPTRSLVWIDRAGKTTTALETKGQFQSPRISPDGKRVVMNIPDGSNLNLWAYEFERGTRLRLTTTGISRRILWSPDGLQVAFYSSASTDREQRADQDLYVMPSTGGEPKKLLARPGLQYPDTWSPDGRFLVFEEGQAGGGQRDLWVLPIGSAPRPLMTTRFNERSAVFSPDGRQLAFVTDESGRAEVYVQPFPGPGPKVPISSNGGLQPMWSRDGRELFYREGDWMMAVPVTLDPFRVGTARRLFEFPGATYDFDQFFSDYDVAPDGRFLAIQADTAAADEIHVVLNWQEELKARVPTK